MANCPSAVPGAITGMRLVDGGVILDITATDPDAARAIVDRAHLAATHLPPDPVRGEHSGAHGGPGTTGHCPVVHVNTVVSVEDIAGGARITVMARDPAGTATLQAETRERIEWLDPSARPR